MKDLCRKFLKILLVELDDLREDLDLVIEVTESRHNSGEITDYVYNENLAVLRNEVLGLADCIRGCEDFEAEGTVTVDEIAAAFKRRFRVRLKDHGYVPALYALLNKRVDKIAFYLQKESLEGGGIAGDPGVFAGRPHVQSTGPTASGP